MNSWMKSISLATTLAASLAATRTTAHQQPTPLIGVAMDENVHSRCTGAADGQNRQYRTEFKRSNVGGKASRARKPTLIYRRRNGGHAGVNRRAAHEWHVG